MNDAPISLNAERANRANDNTLLSPLEMIEDVGSMLRRGLGDPEDIPPDAALVLLLNSGDGQYHVHFHASNLACSEMLALLEVAKAKVLANMGYIR